MIRARLSPDEKWIFTNWSSEYERSLLVTSFTVRIPDWQVIHAKYPQADIEQSFINDFGMIPVGLWSYLISVCQLNRVPIIFEDGFEAKICNMNIQYPAFKQFVNGLFEKSEMTPMDYQVESAFNLVRYRNSCAEISTSGGKTLMAYILFRFFIYYLGFKHILYVTPKTELTTQSYNKFRLYDKENGLDSDWTGALIFAKAKKKEVYDDNIVFGNYQSLHRKDSSFFEKYDVVIIDEAHHGAADSIQKILNACVNAKYKIGMTGTFPSEGSFENFVLQSYIGPVVYRLTSFDLINKHNFATPVFITAINMKYLGTTDLMNVQLALKKKEKDDVDEGGRILRAEQKLVWDSEVRLNYICGIVGGAKKNSLVIYGDIQNGYGKKIYERLKNTTTKDVFYIDGKTDSKTRDRYKQAMEDDGTGNTVIVSSMGCFTEGIDIANLWNIFLVETTKSENTLAQLLGRGMRRFPGKDKTMLIDFVDDFRSGAKGSIDNYLYSHGKKRQSIYAKRGFPCQVYDVDLRPKIEAKPIV